MYGRCARIVNGSPVRLSPVHRTCDHRDRTARHAYRTSTSPTAEWTTQQFRNGLPLDGAYRFLVHDRDGIFAPAVDEALRSMSLQVLKTPVRAPQANAYCERLIGTARRECLDWVIPLNERHLRSILAEWMSHYNGERPHSALGVLSHNPIAHRWRRPLGLRLRTQGIARPRQRVQHVADL